MRTLLFHRCMCYKWRCILTEILSIRNMSGSLSALIWLYHFHLRACFQTSWLSAMHCTVSSRMGTVTVLHYDACVWAARMTWYITDPCAYAVWICFHFVFKSFLIFISNVSKGKIMVLFAPWLEGHVRTVTVFTFDARSSLLFAFYLHFATFITCKSFSVSSSGFSLGLYIFVASLLCSILITNLNHVSVLRISAARSDVLYNSLSFWLVLIFQTSYSVASPYTSLKVFLTQELR
jgi:hypothetical protein